MSTCFGLSSIASRGNGRIAASPKHRKPPRDPTQHGVRGVTFPLADPAGKDSNARRSRLRALNRVPSSATWKSGKDSTHPTARRLEHGQAKMMRAEGTGGTLSARRSPLLRLANAGYGRHRRSAARPARWQAVARSGGTCPTAQAVQGVRVAYADEREIQNALDAARSSSRAPWKPSRGDRSEDWTISRIEAAQCRGGQAFDARCGAAFGGIATRSTTTSCDHDDDARRLKNATRSQSPWGDGRLRGQRRPRHFSGYRRARGLQRAINIVHDAAFKAGVRLCGPLAWRDRPDFTCFQAGSETAAIARGVAAELGPLANTQAKPEVGPYATSAKP